MGAIATGTIVVSSVVTISSKMVMNTPNISSMSTMDDGIVLLESSTVRVKMVTTTSIAFSAISTSRVAIIVCPLHRGHFPFSNRNLSEGRPTAILEKKFHAHPEYTHKPQLSLIWHGHYHFPSDKGLWDNNWFIFHHYLHINWEYFNWNLTWIFADLKKKSCQVFEEEHTHRA